MTPATRPIVSSGRSIQSRGSTSMPMDTKNRLLNTSRSGVKSSIMRPTYSDSDTTIPARKAPRAMDWPKWPKNRAVPTAVRKMVRVNSSRLPEATMRAMIHGNANRAPNTVNKMTATERLSSHVTSPRVAAWPASSGKASMIGTTARSWNSSTDTGAHPLRDGRRPPRRSTASRTRRHAIGP